MSNCKQAERSQHGLAHHLFMPSDRAGSGSFLALFISLLGSLSLLPHFGGGEPKPSDRRQVTKQVGAQLHKKPNRFASPRGPAPLQVRMRCSEPFFLPQFPIGPSSKTLEHPTLALFWGFLSTFFPKKIEENLVPSCAADCGPMD